MSLAHRNAMPITAAGNGTLHRAIVSLPDAMLEESLYEERVVFFEVPTLVQASTHLERLLAFAWCVDTQGWAEKGYIYNTHSLYELRRESDKPDDAKPYYLFETGGGGDLGIGPARTHYAKPDHVDFYTTPRVARRLQRTANAIQAAFDSKEKVAAYLEAHHARVDRVHVAMEAWNSLSDTQRGAVLSLAGTAVAAEAIAYLVGAEAADFPANQ